MDKLKAKVKELRKKIITNSFFSIVGTTLLVLGMPMYGFLQLGFGALVLNGYLIYKTVPLLKEFLRKRFELKFSKKHKDASVLFDKYAKNHSTLYKLFLEQKTLKFTKEKLKNYIEITKIKAENKTILEDVSKLKKSETKAFNKRIKSLIALPKVDLQEAKMEAIIAEKETASKPEVKVEEVKEEILTDEILDKEVTEEEIIDEAVAEEKTETEPKPSATHKPKSEPFCGHERTL